MTLFEGRPLRHAEFALELNAAFMHDLLDKPELERWHSVLRINQRHTVEALEALRAHLKPEARDE